MRAAQGDPDVLIANGGGPKPGGASALAVEDWDTGYSTVMRPMLELVSGVVPAMRARTWGRIVYLGSSGLKTPIPNLALSNAFRAGVLGALKTLSREVAADGVTVNVIATGRIETDRTHQLYKDPETWRRVEGEIPVGRFGKPEEFAPLVVFLCGESARYVTGTTISVDGGLSPTMT
jgi:3-oxoacyl-[acyl-carrier protein] reductase